MTEALIAAAVLLVATIVGKLLNPTPDQIRPISPDEVGGQTPQVSSDHH